VAVFVKPLCVAEIYEEIARRRAAAAAMVFSAAYLSALDDLAGWIESEFEERGRPADPRKRADSRRRKKSNG
jgi:hypothetical protein